MTPQELLQKVYAEIDEGISRAKEEIADALQDEDYVRAGGIQITILTIESFKERLEQVFPEE